MTFPDLLSLDYLRPVSVEDKDGVRIITVRTANMLPDRCCGYPILNKNGTKTQRFKDFPIRGVPVEILVKRQRYKCSRCEATVYEELPDMDASRMLTIRFRKHLAWEAVRTTFTDVAYYNGVDEWTVRRLFNDLAEEEMQGYSVVLPRVLGMDEKHVLGKPRFVVGDVSNRWLLDMQESRVEKDLNAYFERQTGKDRVEVVCQDMWQAYRKVTKRFFPNAVTVIDKFHVVRLANFAVEECRKAIQADLPDDERKYLKRIHWSLYARDDDDIKEPTKERLDKLFKRFPLLGTAYYLKEEFFNLYDLDSRAAAETAYARWETAIPVELEGSFKEVRTAMKNWRPYIFRHWEHRYTNAYVEAMNGLIDEMNRRGRGYGFETLRAKALLKYGDIQHRKEVAKEAADKEKAEARITKGAELSTLLAALRHGTL